ncbi:MAG: hypothetical protein R3A13_03040 [Bdellovibrionota bacterium]
MKIFNLENHTRVKICRAIFTFILVCCTSCSITSGSEAITKSLYSNGPAYTLKEVTGAPHLYKVKLTQPNLSKNFFLTSIEDCSTNKYKSLGIAARRLLVGLDKIKIMELTSVEINHQQATKVRTTAEYLGSQIDLTSYTIKSELCIKDIALWTKIDKNYEATKLNKIFEILEQTLIPTLIK